MLQIMRDRLAGFVTSVIVIILCLAFALWGIQYYLQSGGASDVVAKVNGVKITKQQFHAAFERAQQEMMMHMGKKFSLDQATQQKLRQQVLDNLIKSEAFYQEANNLGFSVSNDQIDAILMQIPAFQIAGRFSEARFEQILNRMLFSEGEFVRNLQEHVIANQLQRGIVASAFVLPHEVKTIIALQKQQRDIGYSVIPSSHFLNSVKVSAKDIANYYQQNKQQFTIPAKVKVNYLELNEANLTNKVKVTPEQLQQYYDNNIDLYSHPAEWSVARVFVPVATTASRGEVKSAQQKIDNLAKEANQGVSFAKLDITYGKPTWLVKQQLSPAMTKVIATLRDGQISKPFRDANGFYIIKLIQHKKASTAPFAQVKERVRKAYIHSQIAKLFDHANSELSDITYTSSDSLEPAAKKLGLTVQTTDFFTKEGSKTGLASYKNVVKAAFSDSVLEQKYNSDVIELTPGNVVVLRVNKYVPKSVKSLTEVKPIITQQLKQQAAEKAATKLGQELLAKIKAGSEAESVIKRSGFKWQTVDRANRVMPKVNADIIKAAFALPLPQNGKMPVSGIDVPQLGYVVVQVSKVYPGNVSDMTTKQITMFGRALALGLGNRDYQIYANDLVKQAKIEKSAQQKPDAS